MSIPKKLLMIIVSLVCICTNITVESTDVYAVTQITAFATTAVNVRKQPTTDSAKLGKLEQGEKIILVDQRADGWSEVLYKNKKGYIKSEYIVTEDIMNMLLLNAANAQNNSSTGISANNTANSTNISSESTAASVNVGATVWIPATGSCYHSKNNCGRMNPNKACEIKESDAISSGYSRCSKCW